jgi:hypothetical protein
MPGIRRGQKPLLFFIQGTKGKSAEDVAKEILGTLSHPIQKIQSN